MVQQVSDFELELMKTIWENGGTALYAEIASALERKGIPATKNTIISQGLVSALIQKNMISAEEYEELKRYWDEGGK